MGHDYNTGIFGCTDRLLIRGYDGQQWAVPTPLGKGDASWAHQRGDTVLAVASFEMYVSEDRGQLSATLPCRKAVQLRGRLLAAGWKTPSLHRKSSRHGP